MGAQDQRPRFIEGQYLGADDLSALLDYGRAQHARLALGAHLWGIATGLSLVERPAGNGQRVDVSLTPGYAWDGFGRPLVALASRLLPELLFADIPYDAAKDDPGTPVGRRVQVWARYREVRGKGQPAGFAGCCDDGSIRVQETIDFEIGVKSLAEQRGAVTVNGRGVDATRALQEFDPQAGLLYDAAVPQQTFPDDAVPARWLIPLGCVRWLVAQNGPGHFIKSAPEDGAATRKFRRHVGLVAETIAAAEGVLVLRNRFDDPNGAHRFARLLASSDPGVAALDDLVWVEGNLRTVGDVRIAGGSADWRDADGRDNGTPLRIERDGDVGADPGKKGARTLRAVIGPADQSDNRFAVATSGQDGAEKLTVLSGGRVGIANAAPACALHVRGDRVRLETADAAKHLDLRVDGSAVDLHSETTTLYIRASGPSPNNRVVINPLRAQGDGRVGIGIETPGYDLDVKARDIKLGLEENGGGQLVLTHQPNDNKVFLEGRDSAGTGTAAEMRLSGHDGARLPRLTLSTAQLEVQGNVKFGDAADLFALGAPAGLRVIAGRVSAAGATISGSGFTSRRTDYRPLPRRVLRPVRRCSRRDRLSGQLGDQRRRDHRAQHQGGVLHGGGRRREDERGRQLPAGQGRRIHLHRARRTVGRR